MIKLYEFPLSPFSRKVKVVLFEKNIPFESALVDLFKRAAKTEEYLKLNPFGRVPVLIDGETVLYESEDHLPPGLPEIRALGGIHVGLSGSNGQDEGDLRGT